MNTYNAFLFGRKAQIPTYGFYFFSPLTEQTCLISSRVGIVDVALHWAGAEVLPASLPAPDLVPLFMVMIAACSTWERLNVYTTDGTSTQRHSQRQRGDRGRESRWPIHDVQAAEFSEGEGNGGRSSIYSMVGDTSSSTCCFQKQGGETSWCVLECVD